MTIVGLHDFVKVSISALLKSLLLIMCIDAPESTTNSRSSGFNVDAGRHLFSGDGKNAALSCSFNVSTLLASFHTASRAPCSCHSFSSCERSSNFGALGPRSWGSFTLDKCNRARGFWSRILVWRAIAFVNFTRWIGPRHTSAASCPEIRNPTCRASENWRSDEFCPNFLSLLFTGSPVRLWQASETNSLSCHFPFSTKPQHFLSSFDLDLFVGCSSTWRCSNEHFTPTRQTHLVL